MSENKASTVSLYGVEEMKKLMASFSDDDGELMKVTRAAARKAINTTVKSYVFKKSAEEYAVTERKLRGSVKIAAGKSSTKDGRVLLVKSNRLGIHKYTLKPNRIRKQKGVRLEKRKPGPTATIQTGVPKQLPHAFVAKMKSGHVGLFTRAGGERASTGNAKIKELISLSMAEMLRSKLTKQDEEKMGVAQVREEITRQIRASVAKAQAEYRANLAKEAGQ